MNWTWKAEPTMLTLLSHPYQSRDSYKWIIDKLSYDPHLNECRLLSNKELPKLYQKKNELGMIIEEGYTLKGQHHGRCVTYNPDGTLATSKNYVRGSPWGWQSTYYPGIGKKKLVVKISNSKFFDVVTYYPSGTIKSRGTYIGEKRHGAYHRYTAAGALFSEGHYRGGKKHGKYTCYDTSGDITVLGEYFNGNKVRIWSYWNKGALLRIDRLTAPTIILPS